MQLSPHFSLSELTHSQRALDDGIDNTAPPSVLSALTATAAMLERIRGALNVPVSVSSGYRCPQLNRAVGGVANSAHVTGEAADITAPEFGTPTEVARLLAPLVDVLGIGQLIVERVHGAQWVHVSMRKADKSINRVITMTDAGTVAGIVGLA